jgi:hypothetical protein
LLVLIRNDSRRMGNVGRAVVDILAARHPHFLKNQGAFTKGRHLTQTEQSDSHQKAGHGETQTCAQTNAKIP